MIPLQIEVMKDLIHSTLVDVEASNNIIPLQIEVINDLSHSTLADCEASNNFI